MLNSENRYLFKFAWKSIQRNAGRSCFIGLSVSLSVVFAVWVVAFFDGMNRQIEKAVVTTNVGFLQVQDPLYSQSTDSSAPREFTPQLEASLKRHPVTALSPELVLDGNISTPEGTAGLVILGVSPKFHKDFMEIDKNLISGSFVTDNEDFHVVIGQELATTFKFKIGDQLVLNYQDHLGDLRSEILTIGGIFNYNSDSFEKRFIYVGQATWQKLFLNNNTGKVLFNRVSLMVPTLDEKPLIKKRLKNTDLKLKSWRNLNPEMAVVLDFNDGMIKFFFLIIGITILMTIITPVQMLWQERLKELRMMNVIGVSVSKFWKIGLNEVIIMTTLSGFFSSILLVIIIGVQSKTGVDLRSIGNGVPIERAGIRLPGVIFPELRAEQIVTTLLFVVFVLSFSYIWSIHRTLKKLEAEL